MQLEGKRIILTGGSGGMGAETIAVLTAEGAIVTAMDVNDVPGRDYAEKAPGPGRATFLKVDVTNREDVNRQFSEAIREMGGLDCLINTAGVLRPHTAETVTDELYEFIFDVNVKGTIITNQAVFEALKANGGGTIINFGSIVGLRPEPTSVIYSASKGAVHSWTRSLAHAWGEHGIRVNAVLPCIVTPMYRVAKEAMSPEQRAQFERETEGGIPLGRAYGDATKDLGPVLVFLAAEASRFITGQLIPVDGGLATVR
ncbi:SDR family NAD(P)-dependent oxidoreductase [Agrobacterium radiobacter]|uniref:SDR family NAD(P)-dependent oxidoreductase n=1 Tax=Agrobacterium radiobacter TaxID=362 RepID=UPI003F85E3C9